MRLHVLACAVALCLAANCKPSSAPAPAPAPQQSAASHPVAGEPAVARDPAPGARLVVLVVVDQLPSWWLASKIELLDGGVGRMLRQGVYYPEAEIPYALTFTASGHAALGTGAPPAVTGILANAWYRPAQGATLSAVHDPDSPVFDLAGGGGRAGISGAALRVDGISEVLARAGGKTISISLKDRSATLMAGRRPDLAIWYDPGQPAMTTSRFYAEQPPDWLRALAASDVVSAHLDLVWTPLPGIDHAALTGSADDAPGETAGAILGRVFPHAVAGSGEPAAALRLTPAGDTLVFDTALRAIEAEGLGADGAPDLLALGFSAQDYAGHHWGQESWERLDMFLRFDDALGAFLDTLDQRVGPEGYAVVLTSDHGATRLVERSRADGRAARRIRLSEIDRQAEAAAARVLGPGDWIAHAAEATLHMSEAFTGSCGDRCDATLDAVVAAIAAVDGVQYATRIDRVAGDCARRTGMDALVCHSVIPGESGHVFYAPAPDHLITSFTGGTSHGSPNPDDRRIPVLVYAPGHARWAAPRHERAPVTSLQVAPTLAELLGVPAPPAATEPPLP